ncbi:hypothetical protein [Dactylosporangium sp. NPDC051484]|uniref:cytochrome b/b6 domain-containing protein n=1 Tax=Dactylosporangium sp. NPDC051484 TaxID=3154942 RepID=UPI00344F6EF5
MATYPRTVRRGLPRVTGGDPWPPSGDTPAEVFEMEADVGRAPHIDEAPESHAARKAPEPPVTTHRRTGLPRPGTAAAPREPAASAAAGENRARKTPIPVAQPRRFGPYTRPQWAGSVVVGGAGLVLAAGMVILAVRWLVRRDFMREFLAAYPGEYHLPQDAPVGIPGWVGWQHFFNVFLMVLIIRSGLRIRGEQRPTVFWSPRRDGGRKISLALWFHQTLDLLWLVNGVVFVILLFSTGQWMRIVPTSWAVFPNALSAGLQYLSLNWPTENGWVNYNSLQQLAYFTMVFLVAPLAMVTGVRMSGSGPRTPEP